MNEKMFRIAVVGGFHKEDVTNYIEETAKKTKAEMDAKNAQIQSLTAQVEALKTNISSLQTQQEELKSEMEAQQKEYERRLAEQEKAAQDALTLCSIKGDEKCEDLRVSYEVRLAEEQRCAKETEDKLRADLLEQASIATAQAKESTQLHEQVQALAQIANEYETLKGNITQIELSAMKRAKEHEEASEEAVRQLKNEAETYLTEAKARLAPLIQAAQAQARNAQAAIEQLQNVMEDLRLGATDVEEQFDAVSITLETGKDSGLHTVKVNSLHELIERIRSGKLAEETKQENGESKNG